MATVHCSKCTAERKGFRRELDSWRHKLIHCIGFESILEGIYGPLLLRDLSLFDDYEPEEVLDWSPEENGSHCSFCNLPLEKLNDHVLSSMSPLSSPSDYSPRPALSESSQSAHRFLQAVFNKKDVPLDCDPNIPLIAQELMKKMIRQFAMEYASKCLLHTTTNGVQTKTTSPQSETADAPLDLTVSRAQEEKELQPDGVLDLSNRKSASLPTSKPSVSTINHKGSGCCLSTTVKETGELQGTKTSTLGAVLSSLCPAHQLLLCQILKLAHQHKLLFKTVKVQSDCCCCHCGKYFEDDMSHCHGTKSNCTQDSCCQHWLMDHCSTRCHPVESKSNCSTNHCALKECGHENDSSSCSTKLSKSETCTIIRPKRAHCHSCQSLSSTNNSVCSLSPTAPSPSVLSVCSLSICCNQPNTLPCSCLLTRSSLTDDKSTNTTENEGDITALKREQSPSPPPLSPIPDPNKQSDDRPPARLDQIQDEETEPVGKIRSNANLKKYSVKKPKCRSTQSSRTLRTNGTLLPDVVSRLSEKLETLKPSEKDASLITAPEAETQQLHCTSKCVQLNPDSHLTEIITTVLHTGKASEYNLGKLINHRNNKEVQSPNTRSRRRQEMLAAMATPTDNGTTRRQTKQTKQIRRELAMLDQYHDKQKRASLENGESILNHVNEEFEREVKTVKLNSDTPKKNKTETVVRQEENEIWEEYMAASIKEEADVALVTNCKTDRNLDKKYVTSNCAKNVQSLLDQSNNSRKARKSKRTIVPPPRFSSYVTEPRKMYFVACFSDTIFNQRNRADEVITPPQNPDHKTHYENDASENTNEYSVKGDSENLAIPPTKESPTKNNSNTLKDDNRRTTKRRRKLQLEDLSSDAKTRPSACTDICLEYTSPIKLMFVSPVKDEEGMRYSLKSAAAVNGSRADECFDPCEESSWSGTPEKITRQNTHLNTQTASPLKSSTSPKPASGSPRSSPNKTSPKTPPLAKSASPKSTTSPKAGSRRSGESTPTKWVDDPHDGSGLHETTPPKRRRGRPKKLGPQLEKKVKRPIGRPRKEKVMESTVNEKVKGNTEASDTEKNVNKNLKITVLYGRSRRNKRMVSEGFDQLQTEFRDACQAVGLNNNWSMLMNTTKVNSTDLKTASVELSHKIPTIGPAKDGAPHSSNIKRPSVDEAAPSRKPGRPAKVKISGISVTVTTVSPRQRKIQINKDKASPVKQNHKRALFQKTVSAKEPKTITCQSVSKSSDEEQPSEEPKGENETEPNPPVSVRHSERVRKPSIHFLHAVATSSSYSRSSALVRRSKQLLLNKTKKDESQNIVQPVEEKRHIRGEGKGQACSLGLQQVATVSVDSIYRPKEVKWWSASVQKKTLNQELARRIRLISDTWVSDTVGNEAGFGSDKSPSSGKPKCSSVVRSLFDCSPNKPRSCSMQQLCSWFMQTTETQSLSIVKKASSRNPYEVMHFPRTTYKKTTYYSPQAERLRKHLKKFARSVPKTPTDYAQAQKKIHRRNTVSKSNFNNLYSTTISATDRLNYTAKGRSKSFSKYKTSLYRVKRRFLTRKERKSWMNSKTWHSLKRHATVSRSELKSQTKHVSVSGKSLAPVHVAEDYVSSEHSSPEKMRECRVFLKKIHSPNNGAKEEERSHSVTLEEGSPSALLLRSEKGAGVNQAVKTEHIRSPKRACFRDSESHSPDSVQGQHVEPMRGRGHRGESPQQPPAKRLRQSRMTGLSGARWRDFVFEN
ncbi:hypothetical protein NL108_009930 [Boleophthalmus pectinirostris]|uniref:uncharacterized protein lcorl isoform X1 n=1 Tax=Boleophthalmus pectinirostris TaxID=150288 RepID=UPI002432A96E|nr:uncharacterized protein lcorl isoform X1 [Boleophthalmus pectinirostris]KAJ0050933.1 hypothetical protein NL108_009930 [Boleophthalmus pectinirostris]